MEKADIEQSLIQDARFMSTRVMKKERQSSCSARRTPFGWVRCPSFDARGLDGWERPDGVRVRLPPGAQLNAHTRSQRAADIYSAGMLTLFCPLQSLAQEYF
jgi:hypothetical protein